MNENKIVDFMKLTNALDLIGIALVVAIAFYFQFVLRELPCPLCLLQRVGLLAIGFGYLLNVHYRIRPIHYALTILAAVFTGLVSLRQIALHIIPNSGGYGSPILGLHMYTWTAILSLAVIIHGAVRVSVPYQYQMQFEGVSEAKNPFSKALGHLGFGLLMAVLITNIISGIAECGLQNCPDNPTHYAL